MRKKEPDKTFRRIGIVGLPNTGKTQVFNNLTGGYKLVANYPSTTLVENQATLTINGEFCQVTDFPGFNSFFADAEEALYARSLILSTKPDCLIQCIDANRLKQSLYLTAELLTLDIPLVISLNAVDETAKTGRQINAGLLAQTLGIPVAECVATEGIGTEELKHALFQGNFNPLPADTFRVFDEYIAKIEDILPQDTPFVHLASRLMLMKDEAILKDLSWLPAGDWRPRVRELIAEAWRARRGNLNKALRDALSAWVDRVEVAAVKHNAGKPAGFFLKLASLSRHPIWGLPFLLVFLALLYFSVVHVAGFIEGLMSQFIFDPVIGWLDGLIPDGFVQDLLIGDYGLFTLGLFSAIGTVLPVLFVFFLVFGVMEDIGYLPNLAILMRRVLGKIGLSGKSVMPLILGFGCKTMATLAVKSIPSRKERLISLYLIAFAIPCSAQLALVIAILGKTGIVSFFIYLFFLLLVEAAAGIILNKLLKDEARTDFIQELPPFRLPKAGSIVKKTAHRMLWFLREAVPIFLVASVVIFLVDWSGILDLVKNGVAPVVTGWLGLPVDMVDALLLTLARNEIGAGFILRMAGDGMLSWVQSIVAVVLTTMFVPCIANVIAMIRQAGWKASLVILVAINVSSVGLAGGLRFLLELFSGG